MPATSILGEMTARSPSPGLIVSEPFRLPGTPEASIWRLAVVPAEHASDAASVYLAADSLGHAVCAQVDVAFSLATRHPAGHEVSLALAHAFQEMDSASTWGVQDMLFAEDLDSLSGTGKHAAPPGRAHRGAPFPAMPRRVAPCYLLPTILPRRRRRHRQDHPQRHQRSPNDTPGPCGEADGRRHRPAQGQEGPPPLRAAPHCPH